MQEMWVQSLGWEDPWRRKWQPTPVFLPGESHGQRRLAGFSPIFIWLRGVDDVKMERGYSLGSIRAKTDGKDLNKQKTTFSKQIFQN